MNLGETRGVSVVRRGWSVLALALVAAVFLLPDRAEAFGFPILPPSGWQQAGGGAQPVDDAPPKKTPQQCFDHFVRNQKKCKSLHCDGFWFFLWWNNCNSTNLGTCMDAAEEVYECCMAGFATTPCGDQA